MRNHSNTPSTKGQDEEPLLVPSLWAWIRAGSLALQQRKKIKNQENFAGLELSQLARRDGRRYSMALEGV